MSVDDSPPVSLVSSTYVLLYASATEVVLLCPDSGNQVRMTPSGYNKLKARFPDKYPLGS